MSNSMYYKNNYSMSHIEMVKKNIDICTSYDVSGCSLKEYPKASIKKGMQNLGKSKFNNNAANRSN